MAISAGDPPPSTDLEGWRQAIAGGRLRKFRLETIAAAFQDLGETDLRVREDLAKHLSGAIIGMLRKRVDVKKPNGGEDIIFQVHEVIFVALLNPSTADGKQLRKGFGGIVNFRLKDALAQSHSNQIVPAPKTSKSSVKSQAKYAEGAEAKPIKKTAEEIAAEVDEVASALKQETTNAPDDKPDEEKPPEADHVDDRPPPYIATLPAEVLLVSVGWRALFELLAIASAGCALVIYLVVPDMPAAKSGAGRPTTGGLKAVYADPRFWRLAPLSATCIGTAWALQGLWAAPWLSDVERLDRSELLRHLLIMAIALSLGALLWGVAVDRLRRRGVGPGPLLGLVATMFIAAQLALILRLPLPSYVPWIVVAAVGAGTVLSYAILAEYFPKELAGRANAALNVFHIGGAFVLQYMTGVVVQLWTPVEGHYPEVAYQTAFALNVGLQIAAATWFALPWILSGLQRRRWPHAVRRSCDLHSSRVRAGPA